MESFVPRENLLFQVCFKFHYCESEIHYLSLSSCPLFQDSFTNLMVVSSSLFYEWNLLFLVFFQVHCTQNLLFQGCFKFTILEWNPLYFMLMGFFKHDMLKIVSPYEFHVWFLWPPWISLTCLFNVLKSAIPRGF